MRIAIDVKPKAIAGRTDGQVNDPGITYNEAGVTYNQADLTYGGVYGYTASEKPVIARAYDFQGIPTLPDVPAGESGYLIGIMGLTYP